MTIADNPTSLAHFIKHLGGEPYPSDNGLVKFDLPLAEASRVVPEILKLGLRCEKVGERQSLDFNGHAQSVATIEVQRKPKQTSYETERNLMAAIIR